MRTKWHFLGAQGPPCTAPSTSVVLSPPVSSVGCLLGALSRQLHRQYMWLEPNQNTKSHFVPHHNAIFFCGNPKTQYAQPCESFFVHVSKRCTAVAVAYAYQRNLRIGTVHGETTLLSVMMTGRSILRCLGCAVVALLLLRSSTQAFRLSISPAESSQHVDRKDHCAHSTTDLTNNRQVESPPSQQDWDGGDGGPLLDAGTSREKFLRDVVGVGVGVAAGISYAPQPAFALFGERA